MLEKWLVNKGETYISWDLEKYIAPQQYITSEYINSFLKSYIIKILRIIWKIISKNKISEKWLKISEGGNRIT